MMLIELIKQVVSQTIAGEHPHLQLPALLRARVVGAAGQGDGWHVHTLRIIGKSGGDDTRFPELPGICSRQRYESGSTVVVGLPGGELDPFILGEAR